MNNKQNVSFFGVMTIIYGHFSILSFVTNSIVITQIIFYVLCFNIIKKLRAAYVSKALNLKYEYFSNPCILLVLLSDHINRGAIWTNEAI